MEILISLDSWIDTNQDKKTVTLKANVDTTASECIKQIKQ